MIDAWAVLLSKVVEQSHIDPSHQVIHWLIKVFSGPVVLGAIWWAFGQKIKSCIRHVVHKEHSK